MVLGFRSSKNFLSGQKRPASCFLQSKRLVSDCAFPITVE